MTMGKMDQHIPIEGVSNEDQKYWTCGRISALGLNVFAYFINFAVLDVFSPFFAFEAKAMGASSVWIGVIFATGGFVQIWTALLFGKLMGAIGPYRMFTAGLALNGISLICFGFVKFLPKGAAFVAMCIVLRTLSAIGGSASETSALTLAISSNRERLSTVMGFMEVGFAIGISTGPVIGGLLYHVGGFMLPFVVVGGFLVAMVPFLRCAFQRGAYYSEHQTPSVKSSSVLPLVSSLWFFMITFILLFTFLCVGLLISTLAVHLKKFGLVSRDIGLVIGTGTIGTALFSPMAGLIVQKTGMCRFQATFGLLIVNLSILLTGPAPFLPFLPQRKVWVVVVGMLVWSLGESLLFIASVSLLLELAIDNGLPDTLSTHGLVSGISSSIIGAGFSVGALIGPPLADHYGLEWVAGGLTMTGTALVYIAIACMVYTRCTKDGKKHNYTQLSTME